MIKNIAITTLFATLFWFTYKGYQEEIAYPPDIDPSLIQYVDEWKLDIAKAGIHLDSSKFNQLKSITIKRKGVELGTSNFNRKRITVNLISIMHGDWTTRNTIYHELGHYMFDLEHSNVNNIMSPKDLGEDYYRENWSILKEKYLKEIINN